MLRKKSSLKRILMSLIIFVSFVGLSERVLGMDSPENSQETHGKATSSTRFVPEVSDINSSEHTPTSTQTNLEPVDSLANTTHASLPSSEPSGFSILDALPYVLKRHLLTYFEKPNEFGCLTQVSKVWRDLIYGNLKTTIVIGHKGSGKSSIVQLMTDGRLSNTQETTQPSIVFKAQNLEFFIDCPCYRDTSKEETERGNSMIRKFIRWNVRLIAVESFDGFLTYRCQIGALFINRVTELCPDLEQLKKMFYFVMTSRNREYLNEIFDISRLFTEIVTDPTSQRNVPCKVLTQTSFELIKFLASNPDHVGVFPCMTREERASYAPQEDLLNLMNKGTYVFSPKITQPVGERCQ